MIKVLRRNVTNGLTTYRDFNNPLLVTYRASGQQLSKDS
jgi:hypothetical protein